MVEQQIRTWDVLDQDVLDLLYVVPREDFVPAQYRALAFSDLEIPLGEGQKMWQPKLEARVLQDLSVRKSDHALEVGTGSGYFAALLSHRAGHVHSVEINPALHELGGKNLARAGVDNVTLELGDASRGWPKQAPYDVIVLTGSTPMLPRAFLDQLARRQTLVKLAHRVLHGFPLGFGACVELICIHVSDLAGLSAATSSCN